MCDLSAAEVSYDIIYGANKNLKSLLIVKRYE